MRLLHTADVHLDASFAAAGMPPALGNRRRQSLRDVFHALMVRAAAWPADAVLIAGDLFELERVSRDTVAYLRQEFELLGSIPVFIAAGNHDPYVAASPYATEVWPGNVIIFNRPEWTAHELTEIPLTVHGFSFDGMDISRNPFGSLVTPDDGRFHVALGHGSERAHQPPQKDAYAPFDAPSAAAPGVHYVALGHFHRVTPITGDFTTCIYYSGAPEGHGFNELGPHHYLEVELEAGDPPHVSVQAVASARTIYSVHSIDCSALTNTQQIVEAIRDLPREEGKAHIVRIVLGGECVPAVREELAGVRDAVSEHFAYLDLVDETYGVEDCAELARESTSLGAFVQRITQEIEAAPEDRIRAMLLRAREVGLAAYRGRDVSVRGLETEAP